MSILPWLIALAIGLPWLGAVVVWRVGDKRPQVQNAVAVGFAVAAALVGLALLPSQSKEIALRIPVGGIFGDFTFVADGLGVFLAAVATVIGCLAVVFSVDYMRGEAQLGRYYTLVLIFIGSMAGLVLSSSLLLLFIFWEMTALCSYALISFYNDDPKAVAGGIKALIITQIGGVGLLAGVLVTRSYLGSYEVADLLAKGGTIPAAALAVIAFGFLLAAAAKSAQFPFQTWLPDAMEAPTPVSALIHAATMVNAGVYLLARFYPAFAAVPGWKDAVMVVGLLSALMAAIMALVATDLKRVLAYSTVSQLGYMVYAVGVGGIFASQFHLLSHAVFKGLLFLGAGAVIHAAETRDMRKMGGLGKQMPFVRNVFIIGALALAGLPILNGFWSKELVLEAGLSNGPMWAWVLMVIGAGITALYTTRMVWLVFFGERRDEKHVHDAAMMMRIALGILAIGALLTWVLAGPFGQMLAAAVPHLEAASTQDVIQEVISAPATLVALIAIAAGIVLWYGRKPLGWLSSLLQPIGNMAAASFGFEWINRQIVSLTQRAGEKLRETQTGQLNWNVVGIVGGLIVVLALLIIGG